MASGDNGWSGLIQLAIFGAVALFGWIANANKKKREDQEVAETQAQLRRMDEEIRAARKRSARTAPVVQPAPVIVAAEKAPGEWVEVPSPAAPMPYWDAPQAVPVAPAPDPRPAAPSPAPPPPVSAPRPAPAPAVVSGCQVPLPAEISQALAWREIFLPPVSLREARI